MSSVSSESWSCDPDVDIDEAVLLMEMLDQQDDAAADEDDDDERLGGVIRSLEAEIGRAADGEEAMVDDGASTTGPSDGGATLMEDLLSDLHSRESLRVEDPFDWAEMDAVANSDLPGWDYYVGAEVGGAGEVFCYGEGREYGGGGFYYGESLAAEQVFDALWQ